MRNILDRIATPDKFDEESINEAIAENIKHLLRQDMSRFAYARVAIGADELRGLPPMHMMEHRLRLPRVRFELSDGSEDGIEIARRRIRERLDGLLVASDHPGGRQLVSQALRVDPSGDTEELIQVAQVNQNFVHLLLRGRLGSAIKLIPSVDWESFGPDAASDLIRRLLIYHGAFQAQLVAARGRTIDRLLLRLSPSPRAYTDAEACKQLCETLKALHRTVGKITGKVKQPPQSGVVVDREAHADRLRSGMPYSDDEILAQAASYFSNRRWDLEALKEQVCRLCKDASVETLHKAVYGATSVEAVLFAATRLIQLRNSSRELISSPAESLRRFISMDQAALPPISDEDVARVLFVYRATILMDDHAPLRTDSAGKLVDLSQVWEANDSGNLPAANTAKKRGRQLKSPAFSRAILARPIGQRLEHGQRIDLLPEFLLQRYARVRPVLPDTSPLSLAKRKREQELARRPRNIRRVPKRAAKP